MRVSFSNWWEQTALNISYTKYFIIVMCCYVQHCCTCYVVLLFYQSFFQTVLNVFGQDCHICPIMKRVLFRQVLFFSMYVLGNIFLYNRKLKKLSFTWNYYSYLCCFCCYCIIFCFGYRGKFALLSVLGLIMSILKDGFQIGIELHA